MLALSQLWLPILLSAVGVFAASSILHLVIKSWHMPDYKGFSNEDEVGAAIRGGDPAAGIYTLPHCKMEDLNTPEIQEKFKRGPIGIVILRETGNFNMMTSLLQWFVFCLVVSLFAGYVGAVTLAVGTGASHVFQVVGTAAFMAYGFSSLPAGIWWGQPWSAVGKDVVDGVIYALVTGALFAWLWP